MDDSKWRYLQTPEFPCSTREVMVSHCSMKEPWPYRRAELSMTEEEEQPRQQHTHSVQSLYVRQDSVSVHPKMETDGQCWIINPEIHLILIKSSLPCFLQ